MAPLFEDASDCRAALLRSQARVAELESQVSPVACWMGTTGEPGGGRGAVPAPDSIRGDREERMNLAVQRC